MKNEWAHLFQPLRSAMDFVPEEYSGKRTAAQAALKSLEAILEVQGARIIQINNMPPMDERGNSVTQGLVAKLYQRTPGH